LNYNFSLPIYLTYSTALESYNVQAVFFAGSWKELQGLLDECTLWANGRGMEFSAEKSGCMGFGTIQEEPGSGEVGRVRIGRVHEYTYLGIINCEEHNFVGRTGKAIIIAKAARIKGLVKHNGMWSYNRYEVVRILWKAVGVPSFMQA
jgi:hypothetical protein